jgi:pyruvyl transferase EpsO
MAAEIEKVLRPLFDGVERYALLDFPTHNNVGDSAIYAGEIAVLDRLIGRPAEYVSTYRSSLTGLSQGAPDSVVLMHGGGNFGDLWMQQHKYREQVLEHCRDRRVIQMPQSIHFRDAANRDHTARLISAHPDFTLLVRDRQSLAIAEKHFECETILCPDMAYGLFPVTPPNVPRRRQTLCLMRQDKEKQDSIKSDEFRELGDVVDWPLRNDLQSVPARTALRLLEKFPNGRASMQFREQMFRRRSFALVHRGFRMLASADRVVTDRLHGHIMSSLLGKPHVVLDNIYGKIATYIAAWPHDPYTLRAGNINEVRARLNEIDTDKVPAKS